MSIQESDKKDDRVILGLEEALSNKVRREAAQSCGMEIVESRNDELQIDIDSEEGWRKFLRTVEAFEQFSFPLIKNYEVLPSKSGLPNRHIYMKLVREFTPLERIALQFVFHSDFIRESLGAVRVLAGIEPATVFFEKKDEVDLL